MMNDNNSPVLIYFPIRGRAEPVRLLLEELGVEYKEQIVRFRDWQKFKAEMPFGKIPVYTEGELGIADSHAIMRYLARKHGLYCTDEYQRIQCDVLEETLKDAFDVFAQLIWDKEYESKRETFINDELIPSLTNLENYLGSIKREDEYWVGDSITIVDFFGWHYLDTIRAFADYLLEDYPRLSGIKQSFEKRPRIQEYLNSPRRPATITAPMASFGGTPETS